MSQDFSEKQFLINLLAEFTQLESLKKEQPTLVKMASNYRDHLIKTELAEKLNAVRRRESQLKVSLLQSIKAENWNDSARISNEIKEVSVEKNTLNEKISVITG